MLRTSRLSLSALIAIVAISLVATEAKLIAQQTGAQRAQPSPSRVVLRQIATLRGHTKEIFNESFSPDGKLIATAAEDGTVRVWDAQTGDQKATLKTSKKDAGVPQWSPDSKLLAVRLGILNEEVQIWDVATAKVRATLNIHGDFQLFEWSPDSKTLLGRLLLPSARPALTLWDASNGSLLATIMPDSPCPERSSLKKFLTTDPCQRPAINAHFLADGSVLTLSLTGAKLWDPTGRLTKSLPIARRDPDWPPLENRVQAALSPDRKLLALYDADGLTLIDTTTWQESYSLGHVGEPVEFSSDNRQLLVRTSKQASTNPSDFVVYDVSNRLLQFTFKKVNSVSTYWSPDGSEIVTMNGKLLTTRNDKVIKLPYGACVGDRIIGDPNCDPFFYNRDGTTLMKHKNPLKLWDAHTGEFLAKLDGQTPARFSPTESSVLVTRGLDKKTAIIWHVEFEK